MLILVTGAWLWGTGQPLQYASTMALAIAFGIAVNDTVLYRLGRGAGEGREASAHVAIRETDPVMIAATAILCTGLLPTFFSGLPPVPIFGTFVHYPAWHGPCCRSIPSAGNPAGLPPFDTDSFMISRSAPFLASIMLAAATPVSAEGVLAAFAGEWVGRGAITISKRASPEPVYCKIKSTLSADGMSLEQKGRCAAGNDTSKVRGTLSDDGDGNITGEFAGNLRSGPATMTGTADETGITLSSNYEDKSSGEDQTSTIRWEKAGAGYKLVIVEASDSSSGEIDFTRK